MTRSPSDALETARARCARRLEGEGYLSLGLTGLLFAIPFLARWFALPATALGIPVLLLVLVFALRGSRSRRGGGVAARISLAVVLATMVVSAGVATREFVRQFTAQKPKHG